MKRIDWRTELWKKLISLFLIIILMALAISYCEAGYYVLKEWVMDQKNSGAITIICSTVSIVPSVLLGSLAIKQTNRLHKLESRYHRPNLIFRKITLDTILLCNIVGDENDKKFMEFLRTKSVGYNYVVDCRINFSIQNEITVTKLLIQKIKFFINDKEYTLIPTSVDCTAESSMIQQKWRKGNSFRRISDGGVLAFELSKYLIHPSSISCTLNNEELKSKEEVEKEFWDDFTKVLKYNKLKNIKYKEMVVEVDMEVWYEYAPEYFDRIKLVVTIDREGQKKKAVSVDGYFEYC